jgi:heme/copper-type cytochrome/quinol oxidase subunit 2
VGSALENSALPRQVHEYDCGLGTTLRVRKGERVKLVMAATDHDQGFKLDDLNINQKIPKGTTVVVEFTADKAGTFQFRCSNVCGRGHRSMKGTLVVRGVNENAMHVLTRESAGQERRIMVTEAAGYQQLIDAAQAHPTLSAIHP